MPTHLRLTIVLLWKRSDLLVAKEPNERTLMFKVHPKKFEQKLLFLCFRVNVLTPIAAYRQSTSYPTSETFFVALTHWYRGPWYEYHRNDLIHFMRPQPSTPRCQPLNRIVIGRQFTAIDDGYISLTIDELAFWDRHLTPPQRLRMNAQYNP